MMTLAAAAVAAMVSQSELKLVDADTSWPAVPSKMRQPTLNSSEIAAVQYREKFPHSVQRGARQFCYLSPSSGGSTCVVNGMPAFPLP
jgi:hypothetical protein